MSTSPDTIRMRLHSRLTECRNILSQVSTHLEDGDVEGARAHVDSVKLLLEQADADIVRKPTSISDAEQRPSVLLPTLRKFVDAWQHDAKGRVEIDVSGLSSYNEDDLLGRLVSHKREQELGYVIVDWHCRTWLPLWIHQLEEHRDVARELAKAPAINSPDDAAAFVGKTAEFARSLSREIWDKAGSVGWRESRTVAHQAVLETAGEAAATFVAHNPHGSDVAAVGRDCAWALAHRALVEKGGDPIQTSKEALAPVIKRAADAAQKLLLEIDRVAHTG